MMATRSLLYPVTGAYLPLMIFITSAACRLRGGDGGRCCGQGHTWQRGTESIWCHLQGGVRWPASHKCCRVCHADLSPVLLPGAPLQADPDIATGDCCFYAFSPSSYCNYQVPPSSPPTHLVVCIKGVVLGAALVEAHPQRPHVALVIVGLVLAQLWGQVVRRAYNGLGKGGLSGQHL
jgi:hypothetical protein